MPSHCFDDFLIISNRKIATNNSIGTLISLNLMFNHPPASVIADDAHNGEIMSDGSIKFHGIKPETPISCYQYYLFIRLGQLRSNGKRKTNPETTKIGGTVREVLSGIISGQTLRSEDRYISTIKA